MAKSFDALKIKKFDLEFSVDPLFKKTKEDFDEGGAMGLLLNHLGVDGKGRLVFDAGDATVGDEEDVLDPADEDMLDLSPLRGKPEGLSRRNYEAERVRIHPLDQAITKSEHIRYTRFLQILFGP